jgi:hypothetical protein
MFKNIILNSSLHFKQTNQPVAATSQVYYLSFKYSSTCLETSSRPSSGAQQLRQQPLVLPLERGCSSTVGRGREISLIPSQQGKKANS